MTMSWTHNSALHEEKTQRRSKILGVCFSLFHLQIVESEATVPL
jgi:hypothetical protein